MNKGRTVNRRYFLAGVGYSADTVLCCYSEGGMYDYDFRRRSWELCMGLMDILDEDSRQSRGFFEIPEADALALIRDNTPVHFCEQPQQTPLEPDEMNALEAILDMTEEIFDGWGAWLRHMRVGIRNDPEGDEPRWSRDGKDEHLFHLVTCVESVEMWDQFVFQLGYLYAHCVMRYYCDRPVAWFEETVCEALSLKLLEAFAERWPLCRLSRDDPGYAEAFRTYLNDYLNNQTWGDLLEECRSLEALEAYSRTAPQTPETRVASVIKLYQLMKDEDIRALLNYGEQSMIGVVLDKSDYLRENAGNLALEYLLSIQDRAVDDTTYRDLKCLAEYGYTLSHTLPRDVGVYLDQEAVLMLGSGGEAVSRFRALADKGIPGAIDTQRSFSDNVDVTLRGRDLLIFLRRHYPEKLGEAMERIDAETVYTVSGVDLT